jgi:hypothetical protein
MLYPLHVPPDHPPKIEPAAGVAVSTTCDPDGKDALQTEPQLIPEGLLVTVPLPVPLRVTVNTGGSAELKVALTCVLASSVTVQVTLFPLQPPPDQPVNVEPAAGVSVSTTCVPDLKPAVQVFPQLIPEGLLITDPWPVPLRATVNMDSGVGLKVAVTCVFWLMVTVQVSLFPLHPPPDHPVSIQSAPGVAVSTTWVPGLKGIEQVWSLDGNSPQSIPVGLLVTVPSPVVVTAKTGNRLKVATADVLPESAIIQLLSPLQAPLHPVNMELLLGVAASMTDVPTLKLAWQAGWQSIPDGVLLTVPVPVPTGLTLICAVPTGAGAIDPPPQLTMNTTELTKTANRRETRSDIAFQISKILVHRWSVTLAGCIRGWPCGLELFPTTNSASGYSENCISPTQEGS